MKVYESTDELVNDLINFDCNSSKHDYIRKDNINNKGFNDIMDFAFGSNTYRRFHHENPLEQYRKWSWYKKPQKIIENLNTMSQQIDYDAFIETVRRSLVKEWKKFNEKNEPTKMNDGIAMKIVNLIMKHMSYSKYITNHNIELYLHVPWDSNTLVPLRVLYNNIQNTGRMPTNPTQKFPDNLDKYSLLHRLITEICNQAEKPKICYEFFCWDEQH